MDGYVKIKVTNRIQQISYISCSRSGVCVFLQFCRELNGLSNNRKYKSNKSNEPQYRNTGKPNDLSVWEQYIQGAYTG